MKRYTLTLAAAAVLAVPGAVSAQTWSESAPAITASATVNAVRQYAETGTNLSFGSNGVTPGAETTVATNAADAATGTSAKLEVRFNAATKITATGSALTYSPDEGVTTYTVTPTYSCDLAATATGTATQSFTCGTGGSDGHTFAAANITGMMQMFVRVGATIPAAQTSTKPAGAYAGTITIALASAGT